MKSRPRTLFKSAEFCTYHIAILTYS